MTTKSSEISSGLVAELNAKDEEIERLEREASACDLLEEQKGTITALNMALGGEDSTSTENLIDSHDIDYNDEGLISLCRKLIAENIRLGDKLESTGCSPISEEVEDILRSENQRLKSQNQMLIERVDSWTRDAQTLNRQIEEYRQDSQTTADALGHIQQQFELANQDRDDWIACHAKVFRELQETKALVGKQAERIKELESEILEQCRINGMGAEREATLLGKVERQSAALNLAREALERSSKRDIEQWHNWDFDGDDDGKPPTQLNDPVLQAQLQALAAINEVLKGE